MLLLVACKQLVADAGTGWLVLSGSPALNKEERGF
jgi:hypothetical protein